MTIFQISFFRFLLVGAFLTVVGMAIMFIFLDIFHYNYWVSTALGNTLGAALGYFLNRKFTFRSTESVKWTMWKFILVTVICYVFSYKVSLIVVIAVLHRFSVGEWWVHNVSVLGGMATYTVSNYLAHKYFTFRNPRHLKAVRSEF